MVGNNTIRNQFRRNSIFQNIFLGIDLLDDKLPTEGVSGGTVGPNELALRPTITNAKVSGAMGEFTGTASPNSTIELFVADPSLIRLWEWQDLLRHHNCRWQRIFLILRDACLRSRICTHHCHIHT